MNEETPVLVPRDEDEGIELSPKPQNKEDSMIQNFRVSKKYMDQTKKNLEKQNQERKKKGEKEESITDVCLKMLKIVNNGEDYDKVVEEKKIIQRENIVLKEENKLLKSMTGKKQTIHKRISIPVTLDQYQALEDAQHQAKEKSIPQFLQKLIFSQTSPLPLKLIEKPAIE